MTVRGILDLRTLKASNTNKLPLQTQNKYFPESREHPLCSNILADILIRRTMLIMQFMNAHVSCFRASVYEWHTNKTLYLYIKGLNISAFRMRLRSHCHCFHVSGSVLGYF